jgi:hypothetical protein
MKRINRELKLDRDLQVASFRRQWELAQVRIIILDGADIGCLQSTPHDGAFFLGQLLSRRRGKGAASAPRSWTVSSARQQK